MLTGRRAAVLAASLGALFAASSAAAATPTAGSSGIGDRLYPNLGNGGYDVQHYDLDLRYATSDPSQSVEGDVTILARATQSLSRFDLDWGGHSVGGVSVNGQPAAFTSKDEELIITPQTPLGDGQAFTVKVTGFTASPTTVGGNVKSTVFFKTPDGSATAPQPFSAHLIYPCNDHPRDKATFTFTFDVPAGTNAIANGEEVSRSTAGGRTTWVYSMDKPMATELTQLAVGNWDLGAPRRAGAVILRDASAPSLTASLQPAFALEPSQLDYMQSLVGPLPFSRYGILVVDADVGFSLETQTLTMFPEPFFSSYGKAVWDPTMVHELSHEWFGDDVSPYSWSDIWLNEGHASWYEFLYAERTGQLEGDTEFYPDPQGYATFDELMRAVYAHGDEWRQDFGPVALPLNNTDAVQYSNNVYHGGALVLYALRQKIGATAFDKLERTWVQRYSGQSASTDDFIALASSVSGQNLTAFLRDWLYGTKTPAMPGHPDWTVNPVKTHKTTTVTSAAARLRHGI
jgi:aminopeptidase N